MANSCGISRWRETCDCSHWIRATTSGDQQSAASRPTSDHTGQVAKGSPQPQRSCSPSGWRNSSISSPTLTHPGLAPRARSRSVLPDRPEPAM